MGCWSWVTGTFFLGKNGPPVSDTHLLPRLSLCTMVALQEFSGNCRTFFSYLQHASADFCTSVVVCVFYACIAASLAELASSIPSSASGIIAPFDRSKLWLTCLDSLSLGIGDWRSKVWSCDELFRRIVWPFLSSHAIYV